MTVFYQINYLIILTSFPAIILVVQFITINAKLVKFVINNNKCIVYCREKSTAFNILLEVNVNPLLIAVRSRISNTLRDRG